MKDGTNGTATDAAAGGDGDLDGVPSSPADVFERQRPVKKPLIGRSTWRSWGCSWRSWRSTWRSWSLDHQRRGVDADRHRDGPVRRHLRILVVETLQL